MGAHLLAYFIDSVYIVTLGAKNPSAVESKKLPFLLNDRKM